LAVPCHTPSFIEKHRPDYTERLWRWSASDDLDTWTPTDSDELVKGASINQPCAECHAQSVDRP